VRHVPFSPKELALLLSDIEGICEGNTLAHHDETRREMEPSQPPEEKSVRRIHEPWTHYDLFGALRESEELLGCVEQLRST
jgi:hypothetical protein